MERFSITLYGTRKVGFTYLLSNDSGLVETHGPGSDRGVPCSLKVAIRNALCFVPVGSEVMVHASGSGKVLHYGVRLAGHRIGAESFSEVSE